MAHLIPIPVLAILAAILIRAELRREFGTIRLLKPICTLLVITIAALSWLTPAADTRYTVWILVGLVLSLVGDVALMFPTPRAFLGGLVAFLLAHAVYTVVFTLYNGMQAGDWATAGLLAAVACVIYRYLLPGLEKMKIPVAVYIIVIGIMVHRAVSTLFGDGFTPVQGRLIAVGAVLFWISDLMLGVNRFRRPFKYDRTSLAFYYSGQLLIALSASYF